MYNGDWGRERPVWSGVYCSRAGGYRGRCGCTFSEVRGFMQYAQPLASALPPSCSSGLCHGRVALHDRRSPRTADPGGDDAVGRSPREPNRSMPALSGPGRGARLSVRRIENCVLQPERTSPSNDGGRTPVVCRKAQSPLDGEVTGRTASASVPESREKPVSKGTGRGDGLRYRLMRRLD